MECAVWTGGLCDRLDETAQVPDFLKNEQIPGEWYQ